MGINTLDIGRHQFNIKTRSYSLEEVEMLKKFFITWTTNMIFIMEIKLFSLVDQLEEFAHFNGATIWLITQKRQKFWQSLIVGFLLLITIAQ